MTTHTRTDHTTCCCAETIDDLKAISAAYEVNQALTNYCLAFRSAYWAANRDRDELTHRLTEAIGERDRARDLAARLEAELARGFRIAAPDITLARTNDGAPETPGAVPREGQDGAENGPSRVADGLEGLDWHSGTPATEEARKSAESDADDDAEWAAREAIERARSGR